MKKLVLFIIIFFIFCGKSYAHIPGQPPYFKINGQYSNLYPFPSKIQPGVELPQDTAPQNYFVNQKLHFEIDLTKFNQTYKIAIKRTKFYWKYGDGEISEGTINDHSYQKPGDYILKILADDGITPQPQLFESVAIHIINKNSKDNTWLPYILIASVVLIVIIFTLRSPGKS